MRMTLCRTGDGQKKYKRLCAKARSIKMNFAEAYVKIAKTAYEIAMKGGGDSINTSRRIDFLKLADLLGTYHGEIATSVCDGRDPYEWDKKGLWTWENMFE